MKLTTLLLIIACLHVSARGFTQNINLSLKNAGIEKVFSELHKQTGYAFFYDLEQIRNSNPVTIELKNGTLEQALELCFKEQPLTYTIVGKTIVIKPKNPPVNAAPNQNVSSPPTDISGRITNEQGEPLAGASVIIKRAGKGDIADANGIFKLHNVTSDDVIEVSFTGYKKQTIKVGERTNFTLILEVAVDELDRAVVQAYGKTTQRFATGNIAKVTAEEIEKHPVMNPLLALEGKVAGLNITQTNGFASAPIKIELRGRNIIGNVPSDPLYIIDGVPLTVLEVGGNSSYSRSTGLFQFGGGFNGPASGYSPFFNINPGDIESIEILKDADATAIYGSRGANGVILITTKKGQSGKTRFDLNIQEGVSRVTRYWDMMNTSQYLQMRRQAFYNDSIVYGVTPDVGNAYDLLVWDTTRYTNWQKAFYGRMANTLDAQASVSGGDSRTSFRLGAAFNHTTNILTVNGADQRGSASLSVSHRTVDQKLSLIFTGDYSYTQSDMVSLPGRVTYAPNAPPIYDQSGNLNYAEWDASGSYPFANLKQPYTSKTNFLSTNFILSYQILKRLTFRTSFGYNYSVAKLVNFNPIASQDPSANPTGSALFGTTFNKNLIVEPQISYDAFIGSGKINILAGASAQHTTTEGGYVAGAGYTSDALLGTITNAPLQEASDNFGEYRYAGAFGRINYNWRNKYIVSLNGRRDGSSRFGAGKQYGNFGSAGVAWIFSEEKWFKSAIRFVSFAKLRASYGTTGSDAVGDYRYLSRWSSAGIQSYGGILPLRPTQHANPDYHWQVNKKLEAAVDLGFLKDRLNLNLAYYNDRCGNQLISFPLPNLTGFNTVTANSPALIQNTGWEFNLSALIVDGKRFKWSLNFNTAFNRNKLVSYPDIESSPYASTLVVGQPVNITKLLRYTGVDPSTGLYTFEDKNKDGTINDDPGSPNNDYFIYHLDPKFFGGLGTNFTFKGLDLNVFFTFKKQMGVNAIARSDIPGFASNQAPDILGSQWQKPGDKATYARFTTIGDATDFFYQSESDGGFTDASFIRLSNLSMSYNLLSLFKTKTNLQGFTVFVHADNLFVITKYKGIDPETQNFGGMPPVKTIVGGINLHF